MGWHRANLLFDTIGEPPEPGSLREAACVVVQRYRWEQEYYKTCVLAAAGDKSAQQEFLGEYRSALLPFLTDIKKQVEGRMQTAMTRAFAQGPIRIRRTE